MIIKHSPRKLNGENPMWNRRIFGCIEISSIHFFFFVFFIGTPPITPGTKLKWSEIKIPTRERVQTHKILQYYCRHAGINRQPTGWKQLFRFFNPIVVHYRAAHAPTILHIYTYINVCHTIRYSINHHWFLSFSILNIV